MRTQGGLSLTTVVRLLSRAARFVMSFSYPFLCSFEISRRARTLGAAVVR